MPDWRPELRARLASLRLGPVREQEIVDELSQHLDERYDELRGEGLGDAEARRVALEELREPGELAQQLRPLRQSRLPPPIPPGAPRRRVAADVWQDVRYAARTLRRSPGFTAAAVLTLALGIGANSAIFSLVDATLFARLPVPHRERIVQVYAGEIGRLFSYPMYASLRDGARAFDAFAAWAGITASAHIDGATDLANGFIVTGNFFELLGITAAQGRLLTPADDVTPGGHAVVVISYDYWQSRFAGRPDIVNREIRLNGQPFTIVGVAPEGFPGPMVGMPRQLYVPMMMQALMRPPRAGYSGEQNPDLLRNPNNGWLTGLARLRPDVSIEAAGAELAAIATAVIQATNPSARPVTAPLVPIDDGDPRQRRQLGSVALLLGGVVAAVLLIACANIANLLLSRSASRRRELAVRLAIGASRARIVRQLLTESLLLAMVGGAGGIALAWSGLAAVRAVPPPPGALPLAVDCAIDRRVLAFSLAISVITGLLFGLLPALRASRPGLLPALKDAAADSDERGRRVNLKQALVVAEVALSLPLLIAAGLFVRSLIAAQRIDPGIDVDRIVSAPLNINLLRYTRDQGREFYRTVAERMTRLPGVESASTARVAVLTGGGRVLRLFVEGRPVTADPMMSEGRGVRTSDPETINANVVGPNFFRTLGIPLVSGRDFTDQDADGRPLVVVVSETLAALHFKGESPLGRRVSFAGPSGPWREIVGVVRDSKYANGGEAPQPVAFLPVAQNHETGMTLYVRTSVPPASLAAAMRREIQSLEPNLPVPGIQTMEETIGTSLYAARMGAWLLVAFGALAMTLAAVGIYGVLSFSIARRTREIGIRLALGASRRNVFVLVLRDGMIVVAIGLLIGLTSAALGARSLAGFLYGVPASDLPAFATTTAILIAVALAACAIPARRAMRLSPIAAIRSE